MVEAPDGPVGASTRAALLRKAVEDCFIGRRFIFGLKVTESGPLFGGPAANDCSSKDAVYFIASQMILPKAAGLGGCTVVSYYRVLLQKAADFELGSADPSKTSRPPVTDLLLIACNSPGRSFNNISLCAAGFLSRSLQRSQHQDRPLTPTPPWQRSLGLVTSSAEQEEGCSTQDSGDENNTQRDNFRTPRHAQKGCLEDHKVSEETVASPLLSLECRSYSNPSFSRDPHSPIEKAVGNTRFSPSPPGHNISRRLSTRQLTESFLPSSLAWDDLPFSESLTEFLCEENRNFDIVSEVEPHLNVQNQKETTRNNLKMRSQDKDFTQSVESTSDCQNNTQITDRESQILLDITNTPALNDRHDLSEQACKNPAECKNKSQDRYSCSFQCHQENSKAIVLPFENEEEQLEEDTYNCSADLFGSSFMIDVNPNTPNMHAETIRTTTGACPVLSKPDRCHLRSEKAYDPNSTPDKQKSNKCIRRDSLILPGTQDLDFIPPSQSTPIVKLASVPGSLTSSYRTLTSGESISQPDSQDSCALDNKKPAEIASSLCTLNFVSANQLGQCGRECTKENSAWSVTSSRHSHRFTPKRRFWKPDRHKNYLLAQQHLRVQRGALNTRSTGSINHDSSHSGVTVCDFKDIGAIIVPPTPVADARQSAKLRRRHQADDGSSRLGCIREGRQGDGIKCKRTLLDQTVTSSQKVLVQTGKADNETVGDSSLDRSNCYFIDDENEACDWSRDLFSDSL
ncbi:hypothetical protein GBF38_007104 [Nibea albiflora]|uniref:Uncharacterized protein n=1 Tax=Nibea albiflora TaxID=240163 RepID=A0ACB7EKS4_NIBAL|nr:hypothetical protein GBF38_007104 [Nibea albiflora]